MIRARRSCLQRARKEQISAPGASWLDHRLVEREHMSLSRGGFGHEMSDAMQARTEHLVSEGLARRAGQRTLLQPGLIRTLRQRELDTVVGSSRPRQGSGTSRQRPA